MIAENSYPKGLPNTEMVAQGRTLYEAERFHDAVIILQKALQIAANGDKLQQAMTLSNLSLVFLLTILRVLT